MELSLEAYRTIVKNVGNRADIATLCRVSKGFQYVAERSLYNTLYMRNAHDTISLCDTLFKQPRLSALVDALTIYLSDAEEDDSDDEDVKGGQKEASETSLPESYWVSIARALANTTRLRYLNIHVHINTNTATAWIFADCTFQLRSFHCDLGWDHHLVTFLNKQVDLDDLYIIDYNDLNPETPTPTTVAPAPSDSQSLLLDTHALPKLSTLECTFAEAAVALVPGRPVTRLKTCFSRSEVNEKRAEMSQLLAKIKLSTAPLRSLDIADSSYNETFSTNLLRCITNSAATTQNLRYIGTLVLPIGGQEV